ncbi:potassium channel family protein [Flavobacterium sp. ASV13]|uniref:potassium channel family protein n=1 Tax=Flavobacterium sp. ASV13 TaxID=1506583 RepID=UPI0005561060|nr:potassium channel family protein [Flavobacterium sp. ASV13]
MSETSQYIYAPKIDIKTLWEMSAHDFNSWRKIHDYPRIINFFKLRLPKFEEWMKEQSVSDEMLVEFSPSKLMQDIDKVYIYTVCKNDFCKNVIVENNFFIGDLWHHQFIIKDKNEIIPYQTWYFSQPDSHAILPFQNCTRYGDKIFLMNELELLDLGKICLDSNIKQNFTINDGVKSRTLNLDFVNLCGLKIDNFNHAHNFRIWFSYAENISINGDLHFIDAYKSSFYNMVSPKKSNLKLSNGSFQRWSMRNCGFDFTATNSNIIAWRYEGIDLYGTLSNSDMSDCEFTVSKIKFKHYYVEAKELHATVKRLYSQIGKRKDASKHFYLEKQYERKSFFFAKDNFREEYNRYKKNIFLVLVFYKKYFIKYTKSIFLNFLWGYGERPIRVFRISLLSMLICALLYYFLPISAIKTKGNLVNSIYYSIVTFTTLGYGDINQTHWFLKIVSALEALLGMSFWGILIAGFTNNSKDY